MISYAAVPCTRTGAGLSAAAALTCAGIFARIAASSSAGVSACTAAPAGTPKRATVHTVNDCRLFGKCRLNVGVKPIVVS